MQGAMILFFGIMVVAWLAQGYLTYKQAKNIQKVHKELYIKYAKEFCIGFGEAKGNIMGKGCIMIVVADRNLKVVDSAVLNGISVFDRMSRDDSIIGLDLNDYLEEEDSQNKLILHLKNTRKQKKQYKSKHEQALCKAAKNLYQYMQLNHKVITQMKIQN